MVQAEWLLRNHPMQIGLERALDCRIKQFQRQLTEYDEDDAIESLSLAQAPPDGMPHVHGRTSRTETAFLNYEKLAQEEKDRIDDQIKRLQIQRKQVQRYLMLYEAVIIGLTERERWIVERYYLQSASIELMIEELRDQGEIYSNSTLRRMRNRMLEKAQKIIDMVCDANDEEATYEQNPLENTDDRTLGHGRLSQVDGALGEHHA